MHARTRKVLFQLGSFALGAGLLWLALRGVDFAAVGGALREARWGWLAPLVAVTLLAHVLRAWRWGLLVEGLPGAPQPGFRPLFFSVMIGYLVNQAAPRLGEAARAANLAGQTRLPVSGLFGTVVVERIVDVVALGAAFLLAPVALAGRTNALLDLFGPALAAAGSVPGDWWAGAALLLAGGALGLAWAVHWMRRRGAEGRGGKLSGLVASFGEGLATVVRARRRGALIASTALMWGAYGLMSYLPLQLLGITEAYGIGFGGAWMVMLAGAVGFAIPSPGGVGSYHYAVVTALGVLYGVEAGAAAAFAVLSHAAQLLLFVVVGFACIVAQGTTLARLRAEAEAVEPDAADARVLAEGVQ